MPPMGFFFLVSSFLVFEEKSQIFFSRSLISDYLPQRHLPYFDLGVPRGLFPFFPNTTSRPETHFPLKLFSSSRSCLLPQFPNSPLYQDGHSQSDSLSFDFPLLLQVRWVDQSFDFSFVNSTRINLYFSETSPLKLAPLPFFSPSQFRCQ